MKHDPIDTRTLRDRYNDGEVSEAEWQAHRKEAFSRMVTMCDEAHAAREARFGAAMRKREKQRSDAAFAELARVFVRGLG